MKRIEVVTMFVVLTSCLVIVVACNGLAKSDVPVVRPERPVVIDSFTVVQKASAEFPDQTIFGSIICVSKDDRLIMYYVDPERGIMHFTTRDLLKDFADLGSKIAEPKTDKEDNSNETD